MNYVVGVDGGSTKTIASVVDIKTKEEVSNFTSGPCNKNSIGHEKSKENIISAIEGALKKLNISHQEIAGICLGLSGFGPEEDQLRAKGWMKEFFEHKLKVIVYNDAFTNLTSGTLGVLKGMIIICGTGSICFGVEEKNDEIISHRAGGWGPLLGDTGNGWSIGHNILESVAKFHDNIGEDSLLIEEIKNELKINSAMDIIPWTYSDLKWDRISKLAPIALKCADKGDKLSIDILNKNVEGLIKWAITVHKKMCWNDEFTIVLCGSLVTNESIYQKLIFKRLKEIFPFANITLPKVKPSVGAALIVLKKI
eukprot:gene9386-1597_t